MKKRFKVFSLLFFQIILLLSAGCPFKSEYSVTMYTYNHREEIIVDCSKGIYARNELCVDIVPGDKLHSYDLHASSKSKPSEIVFYKKIKLKDGTVLSNLRGKALDSAFKVVREDEYSITYRLDVY